MNVLRAGEGSLEFLNVTELLGRGQRAYRATILLAALRVWCHPTGKVQFFTLNRRGVERLRKLLACTARTARAVVDYLRAAGRVRLAGAHLFLNESQDQFGPGGSVTGGSLKRVWARVSQDLYQTPGLTPFEVLLAGRLAARNGRGLSTWNIAEDFGVGRRVVGQGLTTLRRRGLIYSARRGPHRRLTFHVFGDLPQSDKSPPPRATEPLQEGGAERQNPSSVEQNGGQSDKSPRVPVQKPSTPERQNPSPQSDRTPHPRATEVRYPPSTLDPRQQQTPACLPARAQETGPGDPGKPAPAKSGPDPGTVAAGARILQEAGLGEGEPDLTRVPLLHRLARGFLEPPGRSPGLLDLVVGEAVKRAKQNPQGLLRRYLEDPALLEKVLKRLAPMVADSTSLAEARAESERMGAAADDRVTQIKAEREAYIAAALPRLETSLRELTGLPIPDLPRLEAAAGGFTARHAVARAYGELHAWAAHQVLPVPKELHQVERLVIAVEVWKRVALSMSHN